MKIVVIKQWRHGGRDMYIKANLRIYWWILTKLRPNQISKYLEGL